MGNVNSIHTRRWARYFADQGEEVHLVSPWLNDSAFAEEMLSVGASLYILQPAQEWRDRGSHGIGRSPNVSFLHRIGRWGYQHSPSAAKPFVDYVAIYNVRLRRFLNAIKPDLIHGWFLSNVGVLAALSGFRPLVISPWGADVLLDAPAMQGWFPRFARRYSLQRADLITATCRYLAAETAKHAPRGKTVHVVPFGVDCEQFHPRNRVTTEATAGIILGFAKHLTPKYGPEYLVKAFKILSTRYPDLRLLLAGEGAMEAQLRNLSASLGLRERVVLRGYVSHDEMPAFLGQCDIFVMPSVLHSEVFGVAALEASAMEMPVVATRVGGVPEVVLDGETGFLVEARDERGLAEAIATLVDNSALRQRMGQAGREYVLSRYRWEDNAAQMASLYEDLLRNEGERYKRLRNARA